MAELLTREHELTTADLAGQVATQPEGPTLVKGQQLETLDKTAAASKPRHCSLNRKRESSDHGGATYRPPSWTSRVGPSKTLTSSSRR
jgi:hypothetical protein